MAVSETNTAIFRSGVLSQSRAWPVVRVLGNHPALLLFGLVFIIHAVSFVVQTGDSRMNTATALSLVRHGDFNLDEYGWATSDSTRTDIVALGAHKYWAFPWPAALVSVPMMAVLNLVGAPVDSLLAGSHEWLLEKPLSSILTALTTVVIFRLAERVLTGEPANRRRWAVIVALSYAFATSAWSTSSMGLWTHGPSMLLLALAVYAATRLRDARRWAFIAGLCVMAAYTMRPANALSVVALTVLVALCHRGRLLHYLAGAAVVGVSFVAVNLLVFGSILPAYYNGDRLAVTSVTSTALLGLLVSPSRGLLVFTPIVLAAAGGLWWALKRRQLTGLQVAAAAVVVCHWLVLGLFPHWWGGAAYGPRLFTDMLPMLTLLALPLIDGVRAGLTPKWISWLLVVALTLSVLVAAQGATMRSSWCWNRTPVHVDKAPSRIWDWSDPEPIRGFRVLLDRGPREALLQQCLKDPA